MILGYKKYWPWNGFTNFASKIIKGTKKHSLRIDKNNRWKAGMKIQHAHGVRTKDYMQFFEGVCKSTQRITIEEWDQVSDIFYFTYFYDECKIKTFIVKIDDKVLRLRPIEQLAENDGFDSAHDFFRWFFNGFEGKIIHFTDLKY